MRRLICTLVLLLAGTAGALAQARPQTPAMSCEASRQMVAARGAVVLGTGGFTYDRFVRDRSFCQIDEFIDPAFVPTRDTPQCMVGYRCRSGSLWDD
ncbi:hypothetical protein ABE438_12740 [Bosea sp. TWI1241]|jgi:hypothetical protein|uniref:hypothetical protein n=1 Tax=Bosea sp. TWI1241 TaxID=3148904 RepID=UPI003209ADAB